MKNFGVIIGVEIRKEGLVLLGYDHSKSRYEPNTEALIRNPFKYLNAYSCTLEKGLTLGQLLNTVNKYPRLVKFLRQYSECYSIHEMNNLINSPVKPNPDYIFDMLEIRWHITDIKHSYKRITKPGKHVEKFFSIVPVDSYVSFHGISEQRVSYVLDGVSIWDLYSVPVELNEELNYDLSLSSVNLLRQRNIEFELFDNVKKKFTLLDILNSIYCEIATMWHSNFAMLFDSASDRRRKLIL